MPCKKDLRRVDEKGRARRGSQRQIQTLVNFQEDELSRRIVPLLLVPGDVEASLRWVSPLAEQGFEEYQDTEFLERLELGEHGQKLEEFWPKGGPCWDGLAVVDGLNPHGVLLIEAKSHISEINGPCKAEGASLKKIKESLAWTADHLQTDLNSLWTDKYYQMANRFAHLFFLREKARVPAWLINIYFLNDTSIQYIEVPPRSADEWREELKQVKARMGLGTRPVPFAADLFIEAASE